MILEMELLGLILMVLHHGSNDAAKEWTYDISSLFVQSEMSVSDALDVTYGIRYDKYGVAEAQT